MQIDWLTFSAQVVNFLVLVYLLKRFLYQPIMRVMERREESIAARMRSADESAKAAAGLRKEYQEKRHELETKRIELLKKARTEVDAQRGVMLSELRQEIDQKRTDWEADLHRERARFLRDLRNTIAAETVRVSRRAIRDLAGIGLEQHLVSQFLAQFASSLAPAIKGAEPRTKESEVAVVVTSGFELDDKQRKLITKEIFRLLGESVDIEFQRRPDLICGIAVGWNGRRWIWSIASYLDDLEQAVAERLESTDRIPAMREKSHA